jgi:hypothetical protein
MNGYYCYSSATDGVFQGNGTGDSFDAFQIFDDEATADLDEDAFQAENFLGTRVGAHINLSDQRLGYMTLTCDEPTYNVMLDIWTGETLVIRQKTTGPGVFVNKVYHVDRRLHVPRQSYKWRSKIVSIPFSENLAAAKIDFAPPNGPAPTARTVFKYYAGGHLRYTRPFGKSGERFRLPSGFKVDEVQFEIEGQAMVFSLEVASSMTELRKV